MSGSPLPPGRRRRLGEILMDAGLLDEHQLKTALSEQRKWGGKLGRTLVEMGFLDEDSMVRALSRQLNLPLALLDEIELRQDVTRLLRVDIAERYGVFPVGAERKTKVLQLATADPTNLEALQELEFTTSMKVYPLVAGHSAIERAIRRYYYGESTLSTGAGDLQPFGSGESEFDAAMMVEHSHAITAMPAEPHPHTARPSAAPTDPELLQRLEQLTAQVQELERAMSTQAQAMRGFLELLLEKGAITREEYLAKVRRR